MKRWNWLLAALAAGSFICTPMQTAQADEPGWGLMVKSPHVGILYLYITKDGFAIVIKETGAKFVTHSPEWRVVMYNDNSKVYYVERLSDLQVISKNGKTRKSAEMIKQAGGSVRVGRSETIGGLPATQYFINTVSPEGGTREAEIWITKSIVPPTQLHDTLRKIFNIDTRKSGIPEGLPLRVKMADEGGKRELIYDTVNAQKQTIHTASFSYPATYKRVDSELAVLMDEKSRKKMESILDDSDDLTSILGSADTANKTSSKLSSSASGGRQSATSEFYNKLRPDQPGSSYSLAPLGSGPAPTTAPPPKKPTDWWTNIWNSLGFK
ncbi:MAG TPA: hypothetical protein V6D22_21440 [Candidatus Obscuribacterales bacterium]